MWITTFLSNLSRARVLARSLPLLEDSFSLSPDLAISFSPPMPSARVLVPDCLQATSHCFLRQRPRTATVRHDTGRKRRTQVFGL